MSSKYTATSSIEIQTTPESLWEALTNPEHIKKYFFGTEAVSDWKIGSPLVFRGEWEGKPYEDKGIITQSIPSELFEYTYWTAFSGRVDSPENYGLVSYILKPDGQNTKLTVTQDNCETQESATQSSKNWDYILNTIKETLEK